MVLSALTCVWSRSDVGSSGQHATIACRSICSSPEACYTPHTTALVQALEQELAGSITKGVEFVAAGRKK